MVEKEQKPIRIVTILGTSRPGNFTSRALALVMDELGKHNTVSVEKIDPADRILPFPGLDPDSTETQTIQQMVEKSTGVIFATPEYHGSPSSMTKLIIENLGFPSVLAGKPVAMLGVAAGRIGAIKTLEQLRGILSHIGAIVLPFPVSVAGVQQLFTDDGRCLDAEIETQIRGVATNLLSYIQRTG